MDVKHLQRTKAIPRTLRLLQESKVGSIKLRHSLTTKVVAFYEKLLHNGTNLGLPHIRQHICLLDITGTRDGDEDFISGVEEERRDQGHN